MSLAGSKGLTVRATIVMAAEEGIIPNPKYDRSEERRLMYVGMTRAREHLYITWARRRSGQTAWAGQASTDPRRFSSFLDAGTERSQDGRDFLISTWPGLIRTAK